MSDEARALGNGEDWKESLTVQLYIGTYTTPPLGRAQGIYLADFDTHAGTLSDIKRVAEVENPTWLALDPTQRYLLAVSEHDNGRLVSFARFADTGELAMIDDQVTQGDGPCYVSVHPSGRYTFVANYGSGSLAVLPLDEDGSLEPTSDVIQHEGHGPNPERQEGPHAHMIAPTRSGDFVLATDLGLDQVEIRRLDPTTGRLNLVDNGIVALHPGTGPRHFAFSPDERFVYVLGELDATISVFDFSEAGATMTLRQTRGTLPADFSGQNSAAQIVVAPDGRFVYASNRGHDSVAICAVADDGSLQLVGHVATGGKTPRNIVLDPSGRWLLAANQDSDTVVVFRRDLETGQLAPVAAPVAVPSPACLTFVRG
jgi:6-phosphogluconolactonase